MRVAIMQPYFFPYGGYFRLFSETDLFCILDTVQFPRRGWVHRNRLKGEGGELSWLTLPLNKAPREVTIQDLTFRDGAKEVLSAAISPFPLLRQRAAHPLVQCLLNIDGAPVDYLERTLRGTCDELGISTPMVRASALDIDPGLRGQDRILAIAKALGATTYVNAPGGRELYDAEAFERLGMALTFLDPWAGSFESILETCLT